MILYNLNFCECFCGIEVKEDKRFVHGHNRSKCRSVIQKLCLCGCGEEVSKEDNKYINHHAGRGILKSEETKQKISQTKQGQEPWNKGKTGVYTKETLEKMSESNKGRNIGNQYAKGIKHTEEWKENASKIMKKSWEDGKLQSQESWNKGRTGLPSHEVSEEARQKISDALTGIKRSEETKEKIRQANIGKKYSEKTKEKHSIKLKKLWENYTEKEKAKHLRNIRISANVKPNNQEQKFQSILNDLFPNEYKFVGDFSVVIDGKSPDFININGQKKIIELFGDYFHKGGNPEDRINIFKPYGYQTLIIWEKELKDIDSLKERLIEFHEIT